jgi:hypothetical protein
MSIRQLFGCHPETLALGMAELDDETALKPELIRQVGGGLKSALESIDGVTYPSFPPTRRSPNGRARASGSLATQFMSWASPWPPCALFILRVMTHRRVLNTNADILKAVRLAISKIFCADVKSWLATAPMM